MDPRRGPHLRHFNKRQGLAGASSSTLLPNDAQSSTTTQTTATPAASQSATSSGDGGGVPGALSGILGDLSTFFMPSSGTSSATASDTPLTLSSSSSTGSTTTPTPSVHSTSSSSTTTSTSPTPTPTSNSTPTSTSATSSTVYTYSTGTSIIYTTSDLPAASPTTTPHSFLQDHSLEGGVFALVGIVVLALVFIVVTWTIRKRRRTRLERDLADAVTFDPGATDYYERQESSIEKHRLSISSSGHGHGRGMQPVYVLQQEYHNPNYSMGYMHYPASRYRAPSPTYPQPVAQGGANLTRKFSDRKPVPPLLPDPAYNHSNTHVSIPPHFYHQ